MPVVVRRQRRSSNDGLKQRLVAEWREQTAADPRPKIIHEEDSQGQVVHVYVVWDEWGEMEQELRSEIITEAYWDAFGDAGLALTVAMGLTPKEAEKMGID
jgi:hypothetical protein